MNKRMTDSELEAWGETRTRGRGRFLWKTMLQRCLRFSIPCAIALLFMGWSSPHDGEFWSQNQFLIWAFVAITLLVGFGDGWFIWQKREEEYQRKTRFLGRESAN